MDDELQQLVDLIPAEGTTFDAWKQAIIAESGQPLGNRRFNALRTSRAVVLTFDPDTGELTVQRGEGS